MFRPDTVKDFFGSVSKAMVNATYRRGSGKRAINPHMCERWDRMRKADEPYQHTVTSKEGFYLFSISLTWTEARIRPYGKIPQNITVTAK